ncbi:AfsR/SARP family transcriptional regulator [Chloroflexus sp.]|uniref:AfsR/SARP family transcriptional regulator n=1 Tax=Chloroflexus sp. TaxID=1904827 RepID=UPI002639B09E|nr:BTAD domain-containing putative transcriptional regulator [uncultured Chloroflexus sp.]
MTSWHIQLLGGFDARHHGVSVNSAFQTDSARLLFAWLCFHQEQPIRREMLAGLLWPDRPQTAAQNALRVTLSRIRAALSDDQHILRTETQYVVLKLPETWQVDALSFEQATAAIHAHKHRSPVGCLTCQEHLREAAQLYRGEFLAGLTPESDTLLEWRTRQGEIFHRATLEIFGHLTERALREHNWVDAQTYASQQLLLEPWHEAAHRQLMLALAQQGHRNAALAQYQSCCELLQRELQLEPDSETRYLAEAIRTGQIANASLQIHSSQRPAAALDQLPFIGRTTELHKLTNLINQPDVQLISLVGVGGIGKTRLAIRAAQLMQFAFRDGAHYIFLHPEDQSDRASSPDAAGTVAYLARAMASSCRIELNDRYPLADQLIAALKSRNCLLVLDSFEHVAAASLFVNELLEAAPECVALVTSRQRLYLRREHVIQLSPLSTKSTGVGPSASAHLFIELARRTGAILTEDNAFQEIEQICAALDGLPLGIELAAASLHGMSLSTLRQTVQQRLQTLNNPLADAPARHRSLQAVFESTWSALSDVHRQALAMLSIVNAPCPREAAVAITGLPQALDELIDLALARQIDDRIWLHEYVYQFAREKLTHNLDQELAREGQRRHAHWFLSWLARSATDLYGNISLAIREQLAASANDLDAAWRWALTNGAWDWLNAAMISYEDFFLLSGRLVEGLERMRQSLAYLIAPTQLAAKRLRARLLIACANMQRYRTRGKENELMLSEAVTLAEELTDTPLKMIAMIHLGIRQCIEGNYETGRQTLREALAICAGTTWAETDQEARLSEITGWRYLSYYNLQNGQFTEAEEQAKKAYALAKQANNLLSMARSLETLSIAASAQERFAESDQYLQQALSIYQRLQLTYQQTNVLDLLAQNADARGDYGKAQRYYFQELTLARESGNRDAELVAHINLGISYDQMGHYAQALTHTQIALALCDKVGNPRHYTTILANLSLHAHHNQRHELALSYARATIEQAQTFTMPELEAYGYDFQGHALLALGRLAEAEQAYQQARDIRQQLNQTVLTLESQAGLTRVALARNDAAEALRRATSIVDYLLAGNQLHGAEETMRIYWTAYQALAANHDSRAATILALGQQLVQERAERLSDPANRAIYLNKDVHRLIMIAGRTETLRSPTVA